MQQVIADVVASRNVTSDFYLIWLESPQIASEARPGQFVMVRCGEDTLLRRPLSIHRVDGHKIALFFNVVGKGTAWLSLRKPGDRVDVLGPLGNGFSIQNTSHNVLLVAGGIGLAPLCFLAEETRKQGHSVTLLYGTADSYRYPEDHLPSGVKLVAATEDGTVGYHGRITGLLPEYIDGADQVFACGPPPMYKTMVPMPELKDKPVQVSLEAVMGCGRGVCYGCAVKTKSGLKRVCEDGPVFDLDDILWEEYD